MSSVSRTIRIGSSNGLHARPAKLFAQGVKDSGLEVTISKGAGAPVNAASILGVISLGAENANAVLDVLAELLTTDHDDN
jgi:phosphocarrier protein